MKFYSPLRTIGLLFLLGFGTFFHASAQTSKWVATWSTAPYEAGNNTPPSPFLTNNTLRQIVRVSIGGDTVRVKFSNRTSSTPVTINAVTIAVSVDSSTSQVEPSTITPLSFSGNKSITLNAYTEAYSDPVPFVLNPGEHIAITIYYGDITIAPDMTHHYGSRTNSYILEGDHTSATRFEDATAIERWYTLSTLEVLAPEKAGAVAVIGNSITDGYGIHDGRNKWPDTFSEQLLANPTTSNVSVLNVGIGGTLVTTSGVNRFDQDVLAQSGLRWIIVFYGVNDIGANVPASSIIGAFQNMITRAHAQNIRIYGATIIPFKGHSYYTEAHEAVRQEVNEWIRTSGSFDKVIDFDKAIRDPNDPEKMLQEYSNDWLHPNLEGYELLGRSVNTEWFLGTDTVYAQPDYDTYFFEPECAELGSSWAVVEDANASNNRYVTTPSGVQSLETAPTDSSGLIYINFSVDSAGSYTLYARMNNPTYDDDSFWVSLDGSPFTLYNGLITSGWQWLSLGNYELSAGNHTFVLGYREDGATLDKIAISNSFASPSGMGDEALNLCSATSNKQDIDIPRGFGLGQNFPNPFNPSTIIRFRLPVESHVSLKVFDMLGRETAELANGRYTAGTHHLRFNASSLSSGLYVYRLSTTDGFSQTRKMMLLK